MDPIRLRRSRQRDDAILEAVADGHSAASAAWQRNRRGDQVGTARGIRAAMAAFGRVALLVEGEGKTA